jgi:hypothetical protein
MSISAVSSGTTWQVERSHQRPPRGGPDREKTMQPTADLLGLSTSDLKTQLDSGKTLNDIAEAQGVSSDDLLKSIKKGLQAGKPADAPELSDAQLTEMATGIAAGKGPGGHHGHGGHGGPPPASHAAAASTSDALGTLASALGVDSSDLLQQLESGGDLSSLFGTSSSPSNPYARSNGGITGGVAVNLFA